MEHKTTAFSDLADLAHLMRIDSINMTEASKSGHPTTCSSIAELLSVLFFHSSGMRYNSIHPRDLRSDRLVLSKGHAAPILYSAWSYVGYIPSADLLTLRKSNSILEGHPTPKLPFVDVATGSLGQGLGTAAGMAYCCKYIDKTENRYFCVMGDGEMAEGSVWEACNFASFYKLDNLIAFIDMNRIGQSGVTMLQHDCKSMAQRMEAFGFETVIVDGHNVEEIANALTKSKEIKEKPFAIVLKTLKGKFFLPEIENNAAWHGKPLAKLSEQTITHLKSLIKNPSPELIKNLVPNQELPLLYPAKSDFDLGVLDFKLDSIIATRAVYGKTMVKLFAQAKNKEIVLLDADTRGSTFSDEFGKAFPQNFVECFIAEQNMVSVAVGMWARGKIPFISSFGAFLERAYDQVRMTAISGASIKLVGSHVGVITGEDGPSQMALEDLALFKAIPKMSVLYPSDAISASRAFEIATKTEGMFYIRTSRPTSKIIYSNEEKFELGKLKVVKSNEKDVVSVIGAGATLHEILKAYEKLATIGILIRVIDIFSVKPIDVENLILNGKETNNRILVVEDHYVNGGIKESIASAVSQEGIIKVHGLGVEKVPFSGPPEELYKIFGLDSESIVEKIRKIIN